MERIVQIKRKPDTTGRPKALIDNGRQSIGACTAGPNSEKPLIGLTPQEVKLLMPTVLSMPADHPDFQKSVLEHFYDNADIDVPAVTGAKFHIDLVDNNKPLGEKLEDGEINMPLYVDEYVSYRRAIADPSVAPSIDKIQDNPEYQFYIHNPEKEFAKEVDIAELRDEATQAWFKIKGKPEHYDPLLRLYGFDPAKDYANNLQKERDIRRIAQAELKVPNSGTPADKLEAYKIFIDRVGDKNIAVKAEIQELHDRKVIRKAGNSYLYGSVLMGRDLDEAAEWFISDEASADVAAMKGKLDAIKTKKN